MKLKYDVNTDRVFIWGAWIPAELIPSKPESIKFFWPHLQYFALQWWNFSAAWFRIYKLILKRKLKCA